MTVNELVQELNKYSGSTPIVLHGEEGCLHTPRFVSEARTHTIVYTEGTVIQKGESVVMIW